jgi:hypothetical protein
LLPALVKRSMTRMSVAASADTLGAMHIVAPAARTGVAKVLYVKGVCGRWRRIFSETRAGTRRLRGLPIVWVGDRRANGCRFKDVVCAVKSFADHQWWRSICYGQAVQSHGDRWSLWWAVMKDGTNRGLFSIPHYP